MREKIPKINSWASPSPADWLSRTLWVSFKFVVATAAGQGTEGGGVGTVASSGYWGFGETGTKRPLSLTPQGKHLEKLLFLRSSDPPLPNLSHHYQPVGPETTLKPPQKSFLHQKSGARRPHHSGGPGLPMMPCGADLGPAHQDFRMPTLSPEKAGWQVPGTGAGALGGHVQQL